ncbi:phage tail tape measure protein [Bacteroides bouchesdurhonensis]
MEKNIIDIILELKIKNVGALNNVKLQLDGLNNSTTQVAYGTERLGKAFRNLKIPDLNAILGVADRSGTLLANLSKEGISFGQSMANLSAKTGITGNALEALGNNARKVGKESGLGADAAASAYNVLASQLDVAAIGMFGLNNLQKQSITLAQASGVSIDVAASSMAASISQFGLSADEAGRVVNVLAAGSRFGAAGIEDLSQSFRVIGSTATDMGLTIEQSAGALEVLSRANLKGSEAGTALRDIKIGITKNTYFEYRYSRCAS